MLNIFKLSLIFAFTFVIYGCEKQTNDQSVEKENTPLNTEQKRINKIKDKEATTSPTLPASAFMAAEWTDLMPKDDLNAFLNPPDYIDDIVDGSAEDTLTNKFNNVDNNIKDDRYQQALVSARIVPEVDGAPIRLPTFIVPLEFDDNQKVTQFFMVPFFGACLHEPPPPPNQTIYVHYPQGLKLESLYQPYWISGVLKISTVKNELATAAYTMEVHAFEIYSDEE